MMRLSPVLTILLLWLAGLGAAAQFGKISVLFDDLRAVYGANGEVALGLVVSIVGMVGLIFGTTAGLLVGRVGPRRALAAALALGAAMSALQAMLPGYGLMILSRVLEGVSHLVIVVVGPTLIAGLANDRHRPLAMTLWSSFFGVTYAILGALAPYLAVWGGVPGLFLAHAVWMAVLAALLSLTLPPDPAAPPGRTTSLLQDHVAIYVSPFLSAPAIGFCFYTFLYVACLTLLPPATPEAQRTLMATGMPLVSILVSLTLGVRLLSRMSAVRLVQWGYAAAIPGFLLLWLGWGNGWGMLAGGFWLSAALGIVQGASFAAIPELNRLPEDRSRAAGAIAQLGNLGTTTGTPVLAATLLTGGGGALAALAIALCLTGVAAHSLQARRRQARST
jgi:predicted MFS family arabinose efflux permease